MHWPHEATWLERLARWVALHPVTGSSTCLALADELDAELRALGFGVERCHVPGRAPLLIARRIVDTSAPVVGIYGHYDVEPAPTTALQRLHTAQGRAFGRGVGDNLGPLALRLLAARDVRRWPSVVWVLEGEEETGSPLLADHLRRIAPCGITLWLDETGYFSCTDRQRLLLARWTPSLARLRERWHALATEAGVQVTVEERQLRRASGACAVSALFAGTPYAAIGPNDDASDIHGPHESLPLGTLALSAHQFVAALETLASPAPP